MGLEISSYRQIKLATDAILDEDGYPEDDGNLMRVYINQHYKERAEDIQDKGVYTRGTECDDFRAGSYGGYNNWREELAKLAGYPAKEANRYGTMTMRHDAGAWAAEGGPFWELINFSDCEGVIGATVSAKLAKDFADFDERAKSHPDPRETWFYPLYQQWRAAFEMAADGGMVDFH